jgi:hypothetical protein
MSPADVARGCSRNVAKGTLSVSLCCAGVAALVVVWWLQWKNPGWCDGRVGVIVVRESSCVGLLQDSGGGMLREDMAQWRWLSDLSKVLLGLLD